MEDSPYNVCYGLVKYCNIRAIAYMREHILRIKLNYHAKKQKANITVRLLNYDGHSHRSNAYTSIVPREKRIISEAR